MIIEFSVTNFRSVHQKQVFSMEANNARSKADNIFEQTLTNGESVSLVKSAVIYGANASGKSNVIRSLEELKEFIVGANRIENDVPIPYYTPFKFNTQSIKTPTEFEVIFIAKNKEKYHYSLVFNEEEILKEELYHYPKKQKRNLFTRPFVKNEIDENLHIGRLSKELGYKKYEIHKKLPFLSLFGKAENYHTDISPVYTYFKVLEIWNVAESSFISVILRDLQKESYITLKTQIEKLVQICDTQIQSIRIDDIHKTFFDRSASSEHKIFEGHNEIGSSFLPFQEESHGTNRLVALGGLILKTLEKGGVIVFDELESSLHPYISRFLVRLFLNKNSNPHNAQLIFTSHDYHLMDKEIMRADQIWFAEKTEFGETEIFSAQDFDGVREDIPFDKWYMAGKFGAVPHINEIEFIFGDDKEKEIAQ
jgi:AAA15 family ATPase/GTPase